MTFEQLQALISDKTLATTDDIGSGGGGGAGDKLYLYNHVGGF